VGGQIYFDKKYKPHIFQLESHSKSQDEIFSLIFMRYFFTIGMVFIIAFQSTHFIPIGQIKTMIVEVIPPQKSDGKRLCITVYLDGKSKELMPSNESYSAIQGCDFVALKLQKSLFNAIAHQEILPAETN